MIRLPKSTPGRLIPAAAVFLATAAAGWLLVADSPQGAGDRMDGAGLATKVSDRSPRTARSHGPSAQARAQLQAIRQAGGPRERLRATIALVNSLTTEELERWIRGGWFQLRGGYELALFDQLAQERWGKEDPEGFLAWSLSNDWTLLFPTLQRLAEQDPQRLLAFFQQHPDPNRELFALGFIADTDPELAFARYQELIAAGGIELAGKSHGLKLLRKIAESSPEILEAALDTLPDDLREDAELLLIGERSKTDFAGELRKLRDRPDGLAIFQEALRSRRLGDIGEKLLAEVGDFPPAWKSIVLEYPGSFLTGENAAAWLDFDYAANGFTDEQARTMKVEACKTFARTDPAAAFRAMKRMGLNEESWKDILNATVRENAGDEAKTAELLALLGSEEDRKFARWVVADHRAFIERAVTDRLRKDTPEEWIQRAGAHDRESVGIYQLRSQLNDWTQEQLAELGSRFQSMPEENKLVVAEVLASGGKAYGVEPGLQGDAILYMISHPEPGEGEDAENENNERVQMASMHAVRWGELDPQAASAWASRLPAGDTRLWAQKNLARNWAQYDPAAARQWVATLPAADREAVDEFMKAPPVR